MSCSNYISGSVQGLTAHFIKPINVSRLRINVSSLHLLKKSLIHEKIHNIHDPKVLKILLTKNKEFMFC
jgi:hypothetical protein